MEDEKAARVAASAEQRGLAAEIRQRDDNNEIRLTPTDRRILNRIIHDRDLTHVEWMQLALDEIRDDY